MDRPVLLAVRTVFMILDLQGSMYYLIKGGLKVVAEMEVVLDYLQCSQFEFALHCCFVQSCSTVRE